MYFERRKITFAFTWLWTPTVIELSNLGHHFNIDLFVRGRVKGFPECVPRLELIFPVALEEHCIQEDEVRPHQERRVEEVLNSTFCQFFDFCVDHRSGSGGSIEVDELKFEERVVEAFVDLQSIREVSLGHCHELWTRIVSQPKRGEKGYVSL